MNRARVRWPGCRQQTHGPVVTGPVAGGLAGRSGSAARIGGRRAGAGPAVRVRPRGWDPACIGEAASPPPGAARALAPVEPSPQDRCGYRQSPNRPPPEGACAQRWDFVPAHRISRTAGGATIVGFFGGSHPHPPIAPSDLRGIPPHAASEPKQSQQHRPATSFPETSPGRCGDRVCGARRLPRPHLLRPPVAECRRNESVPGDRPEGPATCRLPQQLPVARRGGSAPAGRGHDRRDRSASRGGSKPVQSGAA
jgi:hypothetical protein